MLQVKFIFILFFVHVHVVDFFVVVQTIVVLNQIIFFFLCQCFWK